MSDRDLALEALAEVVVFAHEHDAAAAAAAAPDADRVALAAFERTAALAAAALAGRTAPPAGLQTRLQAAGLKFLADRRSPQWPSQPAPMLQSRPGPGSGWTLAAGLLIGSVLGFGLCRAVGCPTAAAPDPEPAALLASDPAALHLPWQKGASPLAGSVTGEVVWSQREQRGLLRFQGLPPLDSEHRFQLWIVDANRDGAPVDGGLFTVTDRDAETTIAVQPRLPVAKPAAFVVTVEAKDGVVVSKQEHVVALARL